uniref:zinc finger BED domain-containing protein DAYSLEEPER-like n=1 Tax=Fragaria vesca subsp. vesca TaxID=101020 RepID=UPI0005C93F95|nr:PREDICTED: zinc finger BED domain-containing protein DAYSLEEPER-like [Fragaria vesca subsp. vesca]
MKVGTTDHSGQQDKESRKRARNTEEEEAEHPMAKTRNTYKDEEDSDDEVVLSPAGMRRESILQSLRFMYDAHKDGRLKKTSRTPSPLPCRELAAPPSPLTDQEACLLNYVFSEPPPENIEDECLAVYASKEKNIRKLIDSVNSKVNLSVDLLARTSPHHQSPPDYYMVLRGHFIDDDEWSTHRPILNVVSLSERSDIHKVIQKCIADWNLSDRVFSFTADGVLCSSIGWHLQPFTSTDQRYCYSRVITRLAIHALEFMKETIRKVRGSIKYVLSSQSRREMFLEVKERVGIRSKRQILLDDEARWDTTYHMLVAASKMKTAFACLSSYDAEYDIVISTEEWKQLQSLITYMSLFFKAAKMANASPVDFFPVVARIQRELKSAASCEDPFISLLTTPLHHEFQYFWDRCYVLLAIAHILDPRVKLATLQQELSHIYGDHGADEAESVRYSMNRLWSEYSHEEIPEYREEEIPTEGGESMDTIDESMPLFPLSNFDLMIQEWKISERARKRKFDGLSELDKYLEDVVYSTRWRRGRFDVLVWWKQNKVKYPTLSRMACDILALPVSTIDYDSVFDTTAVKTIHSSLSIPSLEALICAKDWLK